MYSIFLLQIDIGMILVACKIDFKKTIWYSNSNTCSLVRDNDISLPQENGTRFFFLCNINNLLIEGI